MTEAKVLFYISGHGWGHATRMVAVMNELAALAPGLPIAVRTMASEWVFSTVTPPVAYMPTEIDAAVVEKGMLHQDIPATFARAQRIERERKGIVAREAAWVKGAGIRVIVSDIPPLASDIGAAAGIPTVATGNFSWDYIYQPFTAVIPEFAGIVESIRRSYARTAMLLRLPFHHDMDAFPRQRDIPLIVRRPSAPREQVRQELGIEAGKRLVLVALRQGEVPQAALISLVGLPGVQVLSLNHPPEGGAPDGRWGGVLFVEGEWSRRFSDLVSASDIVVSKLGYGIVAECVALRTAIAYPPRSMWSEQPHLAEAAGTLIPAAEMPEDAFYRGDWAPYVRPLLAAPMPEVQVDASGTRIAAEYLLSLL